MSSGESRDGRIYTETIVHSPPEQFAADAPYQLAIIDLDRGGRLTVRVLGKEPQERARIGDRVLFVEVRDGVAYYRKASAERTGGLGSVVRDEKAPQTAETPRPLV